MCSFNKLPAVPMIAESESNWLMDEPSRASDAERDAGCFDDGTQVAFTLQGQEALTPPLRGLQGPQPRIGALESSLPF